MAESIPISRQTRSRSKSGRDRTSIPTAPPLVISTSEDTTYTIGQADFGFSDPDGNSFQAVKFGTINLIGGGTLQNNGVNVTSGSAVPVSDILLGRLRYTPPADQHASPQITIAFQVQDNGGTDNGGVDTDPTPKTLSINVNSISDGPTSANFTKGISEGQKLSSPRRLYLRRPER